MKILKFSTCISFSFHFISFWIDSVILVVSSNGRIYTSLNLNSYDLGFYNLFHLENQQTSANY